MERIAEPKSQLEKALDHSAHTGRREIAHAEGPSLLSERRPSIQSGCFGFSRSLEELRHIGSGRRSAGEGLYTEPLEYQPQSALMLIEGRRPIAGFDLGTDRDPCDLSAPVGVVGSFVIDDYQQSATAALEHRFAQPCRRIRPR